MISRRDIFHLALARAAELDRQQSRLGCAGLAESPLSVTDRIREVEHRTRHMLTSSQQGASPSLPVIFDAMAHLASLAQVVDHQQTLDVTSGDEAA